jgi:YD repeat-containing protein
MQYTIIGLAVLLASPALAQEVTRKFFDANGQVIGSSTTHGDRTKYFDASGRQTGSSTTARDGRTQFYNASGRQTGSSTSTRK